jgi:dihydrofolate reductase
MTVFVSLGISLDGYLAGPDAHPGNPMGGAAPRIHAWLFDTASFREHLQLGGGSTGPDNDRVKHTFERTGASIMGRRMFDEGEVAWPEEAPFGHPVFVVTNHPREPWVRKGTTFTFVTDGIQSALAQATEAAGDRDVRIAGGANLVQQYLAAGLVEELNLDQAPVLLGAGIPLFAGPTDLSLTPDQVTHLSFTVTK